MSDRLVVAAMIAVALIVFVITPVTLLMLGMQLAAALWWLVWVYGTIFVLDTF